MENILRPENKWTAMAQPALSPWVTAPSLDWSALTNGFQSETVPKGKILYHQGSTPDEMFLIQKGRVLLECCHANGKKRAIYVISTGVPLGESGAMFSRPRDFQALTSTKCQLYRIPAPEFRRRVEASSALAVQLLKIVAQKGHVLAQLVAQSSFLPLPARLAQTLLTLSRQYGRPVPGGILLTIRFTHQEMADLLGVSRVAMTQCLRQFTLGGLIARQDGSLLLQDLPGLERLRGGG